jgi:hypothetical protein
MKKICLLAVSFSMGHSLTNLEKCIAKKSIDRDDNHFQSLCPSLRYCNNKQNLDYDCNYNRQPVIKIDREANIESNDSLLKACHDSAGSISKFRNFANNFTGEL